MDIIPGHCPGFDNKKIPKTMTCKCPECGKETEVFSDELDRNHKCKGCGSIVDLSTCAID